ncbi:MAG: N-acetylglucosamine-6-phosphate deacetylase [Bullifex sp.]
MIFKGVDVTDNKAKEIKVEDGIITSVTMTDSSSGNYLSNSFIDMQVNGFMGIDYSGDDLSEDKIVTLSETLAQSGTLRHVPTIITNSEERIKRNLKVIADAVSHSETVRDAIAGVHIEGPFISAKDGPRGAHDPMFVREPDAEEVKRWQRAAEGLVSIITIAPEKKSAAEFTKAVTAMGINVAVGHSEPDDAELEEVVDAGAVLSTHLGNGSSAMLPRLKNHIWWQAAEDRLTAGIICDGFHLPPSVVKTFYRTKGIDRLILVSDVALLGGLAPGAAKWGNIDVEICEDGHLSLAGTSLLAGAGHLLDWDLVHFMKFTGASLHDAVKTVTVNPARILGVKCGRGFKVGDSADIISFTLGPDRLNVNQYAFGKGRKG